MKDKGVDFVLTCMDNSAALNLAKEMRKQDLDAIQYLPNGYDAELIAANAEFFEGDIVGVPFAPFETRPKPAGPGRVRQVDGQGRATRRTSSRWPAGSRPRCSTRGCKAAGPNFTRQKVIDALNKMTDQTLGGLIPPRDWTKEHDITHDTVVHGATSRSTTASSSRRSPSRASRSCACPTSRRSCRPRRPYQ